MCVCFLRDVVSGRGTPFNHSTGLPILPIYSFTIVDFLQEHTLKKIVEVFIKVCLLDIRFSFQYTVPFFLDKTSLL